MNAERDHGGGIDAAIARFGGSRASWLDLSTGINPLPYPVGEISADAWNALPDRAAQTALTDAARRFWQVPEGAAVLAAPGASALIARIPHLAPPGRVAIAGPTYNEHAASFAQAGWNVTDGARSAGCVVSGTGTDTGIAGNADGTGNAGRTGDAGNTAGFDHSTGGAAGAPVSGPASDAAGRNPATAASATSCIAAQVTDHATDQVTAQVVVHPNNPTGRLWSAQELHAKLRVIDESFCDITPGATLISDAATPGTLVLKSFGKFWGLAGLRLGFAIGDPALVSQLAAAMGPWPVSGPALRIGARALTDHTWAASTRARLATDSARLDRLMQARGARLTGGTGLFRLYEVPDAAAWQDHLAAHHIWSRIFPYSSRWLRLGLPATERWDQLQAALQSAPA
ncbi:threonine-phosphate decarboxylase [Candidatus Halocynthiibacter alkanivorans]|uniref:threonine-phosphate decarboxylase n=1 Tax=Candidatus Halocynthiibacter alkanivorans TaxID=2267619 RepID=UPI001F3E369E|nr:threonine-phosphate decarboxylase [Candidatus Halocynthiibacter alkanivorans]